MSFNEIGFKGSKASSHLLYVSHVSCELHESRGHPTLLPALRRRRPVGPDEAVVLCFFPVPDRDENTSKTCREVIHPAYPACEHDLRVFASLFPVPEAKCTP